MNKLFKSVGFIIIGIISYITTGFIFNLLTYSNSKIQKPTQEQQEIQSNLKLCEEFTEMGHPEVYGKSKQEYFNDCMDILEELGQDYNNYEN